MAKGAGLLGETLRTGLLAGAALTLLTYVVARYGPSGAEGAAWSLRGNGALIVPFGLGPAIVAAAWTALVLHYRSAVRWLALGVRAGLIGATFLLAAVAALVLFGAAGFPVAAGMSVFALGWLCIAPVMAGLLRVGRRAAVQTLAALLEHLLTGPTFPIAPAARLLAASRVLPPV